MDQQYRGTLCQSQPLEKCATMIQALVRGFLCRKDCFVIETGLKRYSSYVSALTVEGFSKSTLSMCSYQDDLLEDEHPGFEGSNHSDEFCSPIRQPRRIASKESNNCMLTVVEDDEHPGFDSPNPDEEPVRRPTRMLSQESVDSKTFVDEGSLLFSPTTVDAACARKRNFKMSKKLMKIQEMPFSRGQKALASRQQLPRDRPVAVPTRQRSDVSKGCL